MTFGKVFCFPSPIFADSIIPSHFRHLNIHEDDIDVNTRLLHDLQCLGHINADVSNVMLKTGK